MDTALSAVHKFTPTYNLLTGLLDDPVAGQLGVKLIREGGRAHQLFLIILPSRQGNYRVVSAFMQDAKLVLSQGANPVSVVELPDL